MSVPVTAVLLVRAVGFHFVLLGGTLAAWDLFLRLADRSVPRMDDKYFAVGITPHFIVPAVMSLAVGIATMVFSSTLARWLSKGTGTPGQ